MQDDFQRAFEAARAKYSAADWCSLEPTARTAAIYEELRKLDAETIVRAGHRGNAQVKPAGGG
jgi:hypothetical protein